MGSLSPFLQLTRTARVCYSQKCGKCAPSSFRAMIRYSSYMPSSRRGHSRNCQAKRSESWNAEETVQRRRRWRKKKPGRPHMRIFCVQTSEFRGEGWRGIRPSADKGAARDALQRSSPRDGAGVSCTPSFFYKVCMRNLTSCIPYHFPHFD